MKTILIDTTRKNLSIILFEDRQVVLKSITQSHNKHANYLMSEISNILTNVNISLNDIDNIIVLNGPGSFTGIRVGVTVAKTLAWILTKKLYIVNNLKAISFSGKSDFVISIIEDNENASYAGIYSVFNSVEGYYSLNDKVFDIKGNQIELVAMDNSDFLNKLKDKLDRTNNVVVNIIGEYNYSKILDYALSNKPINPHHANALYIKKIDVEK